MAFSQNSHGLHQVRAVSSRRHKQISDHLFRFLVVVLGTYQQLLNQKMDIMSSVEEDNFDRAFELIGPGKNS